MAQTATAPEIPAPRLKVHYRTELRQRLQQELGLPNIMQVPRPVKIVINMGVGDAIRESRQLEGAVRDLTAITGQKPQVTKAKQSIAGFKIREGQSIGAKVTLRGDRMWEFLDRLVSVALPRIRDFRGVRSEERRVGKEWRSRWSPYHLKKNKKEDAGGHREKGLAKGAKEQRGYQGVRLGSCDSFVSRLSRVVGAGAVYFFFFFQAEDGIRDLYVTGVQTCALPISLTDARSPDLQIGVSILVE